MTRYSRPSFSNVPLTLSVATLSSNRVSSEPGTCGKGTPGKSGNTLGLPLTKGPGGRNGFVCGSGGVGVSLRFSKSASIRSRTCRVDYTPPAGVGMSGAGLDVSVALLGSGIITKVRSGENRGRELEHDFVVLQFETAELISDKPGRLTATVVVPPRADVTARRHAISAWITRRGDLAPLQAAGGWIE